MKTEKEIRVMQLPVGAHTQLLEARRGMETFFFRDFGGSTAISET